MKVSIVVPTYNEAENMKILIPRINKSLAGYNYEIIVVDDSSPDGTAEIAKMLSREYPVKVFVRKGKLGLASAILYGFSKSDGDVLGVIDADLQHPPEILCEMVKKIEEGYDLVIASRYIKGGGIENWSFLRKMISRGAVLLARPLTSVKDPMSGCFLVKKSVIEKVRFNPTGYKLLLEILVKGKYKRVAEVPYVFRERRYGESKLGAREILKYIKLLAHLYMHKFAR